MKKRRKRKMNARDHIKAAIQIYRDYDGATDFGSYRDLVTDMLHILKADTAAHKVLPTQNGYPDYFHVCNEGWDIFVEECVNAEINIIDKAARENKLPLLVNHKWEYSDAEEYYKEKLKNL